MPRNFLALRGGFLWTKRGLITASEVGPREEILGINSRGSCSWQSAGIAGKQKSANFRIVVTDHCVSVVAGDSWIFTTRGAIRARDVSAGDIVELVVAPRATRGEDATGSATLRDSSGAPWTVNAGLSFVLGLQKRVRRIERNAVWVSCSNREEEIRVAGMINEWLAMQDRKDKIFFGQGGVLAKSPILVDLCNLYGSFPPPREVRCSPALLASFLEGYSESSVMFNNSEDPRTYFQLPFYSNLGSRFVILALRFFGIEPVKTRVLSGEDGSPLLNAFIPEPDYATLSTGKPGGASGRLHNYSVVKDVLPLEADGTVIEIQGQDEHWSPVVEAMLVNAIR